MDELTAFTTLLKRSSFPTGATIIRAGDEAREMFFLARGHVSVFVTLASGARKRLATFSPGMVFGEMALIDRAPRSAVIAADAEVECDILGLEDFDRLDATHPGIKIKLLQSLSLQLSRRLRKANRELSLFD